MITEEYSIAYTGEYPNACRGDLVIHKNEEEIYRTKPYSFLSSGSCGFLNDYSDEYVTRGSLEFYEEKEKKRLFDFCVQQENGFELYEECLKVINEFDGCCCGGCL